MELDRVGTLVLAQVQLCFMAGFIGEVKNQR